MFGFDRRQIGASESVEPMAGRSAAYRLASAEGRRRSARLERVGGEDSTTYQFLLGTLVDDVTLARACRIAWRWHTNPHKVLIALGDLTEPAYAASLASHAGLEIEPYDPDAVDMVEATSVRPDELALLVHIAAIEGRRLRLGVRDIRAWRWLSEPPSVSEAADLAANGLKRSRPEWSAATPMWLWQILCCVVAFGLLTGGASVDPGATLAALFALIALPFVVVTVVRALSLWQLARSHTGDAASFSAVPDSAALPVYTVMVPLHDEAEVVTNLLDGLLSLDYPPNRLDILLVLEESDAATRARFAEEVLPSHMRLVVVPTGKPQTKPRALNFAMTYARGDFVVVYDAEDEPEPDQLRQALAAFRRDPEHIGCVQARLNIYNPRASLLTRQFTIEYSALFDGILPTLARFDLPAPLGGTSNHFPRALLDALGGWDPYNVTEDADLGIRLARRRWRLAVIGSTTWEEAPRTLPSWFRQRTRWLKGWMQTMLVHMRRPGRLWRDLGALRFIGLQGVLGFLVLAALVHPWFYVLIAVAAWQGQLLVVPDDLIGMSLWGLAALNLLVGYSVAMLLGLVAALRRGHVALALHVLLLPFYWLAISLAAYRALYQLIRDPFLWEKTTHYARQRSRQRG